jgi:hypothetical protein
MSISTECMDELTAQTVSDLGAVGEESSGGKLALAGPEVLLFIAGKIVIPVLCAFIKDVLYEKYKSIRTRAQLAEAKKQLAGAKPAEHIAVAESVVVTDLVTALEDDGIGRDVAEKTVRAVIARTQARLQANG